MTVEDRVKAYRVESVSRIRRMNPITPMRTYLNLCGRMNLTTGKNLHFNVLDGAIVDWSDATLTLVREHQSAKFRVIGGWGGCGVEGAVVELVHGQTHAFLDHADIIARFPCTPEGMEDIKQMVGGNSVLFATLD